MGFMKKLLFFLTLFFCFFYLKTGAAYASTQAYKITDPFQSDLPNSVGNMPVFFSIQGSFTYRGGTVVLSRNPDGTGAMDVGDYLQLLVLNGSTFDYRAAAGDCSTRHQMPVTDVTNYLNRPGGVTY